MAQYTLGQDGAEEFERARLALLEEVHDPYLYTYWEQDGSKQCRMVRPRCGRKASAGLV
jgi:hypothetical protein